ncbi:hypothetical protein [uncultured Sphingomonas sp.]|uniref:hypothetical protein n=1 Tax=uncultured Sphingomonas sp. TaxID=158754 RepID=UPI0035CBC682
MPNPIIKQFVVQGVTGFPLEMLHTDQCWPARAVDAAAIAESQTAPRPAKIIMATAAKYAPNRQRWGSFGWRVID